MNPQAELTTAMTAVMVALVEFLGSIEDFKYIHTRRKLRVGVALSHAAGLASRDPVTLIRHEDCSPETARFFCHLLATGYSRAEVIGQTPGGCPTPGGGA